MNSKHKSVPMSETMSKYEGQTRTGKTANSKRVAVRTGATAVGEGGVNVGGNVGGNIITGDAVHIDALGDVGDVITGTKLNLINHTAIERVASKRQIASPPDDYITRAAAEEDLKALLIESEGFRIIYLYGLPGVGKSWLARQERMVAT